MVLVVASPRAVLVADEDGHVAYEAIGRRDRVLGDDGPVVADPPRGRPVPARRGPLQVADVDGQHAAGTQRLREGDERALDRRLVRQVTERVPDADDGVVGRAVTV